MYLNAEQNTLPDCSFTLYKQQLNLLLLILLCLMVPYLLCVVTRKHSDRPLAGRMASKFTLMISEAAKIQFVECCPSTSSLPLFWARIPGYIHWGSKTLNFQMNLSEWIKSLSSAEFWGLTTPQVFGNTWLQRGSYNPHHIGTQPVLVPSAFFMSVP